MVSPYLLRPVRSLNEVTHRGLADEDLESVIRRIVTECRAGGLGPHEQMNRAAMAVLKLRPELTPLDALALVQRATKTRSI